METLKAAVIGVGHLGNHHARILSEFPDVTLVGVCDVDKNICQSIASRYGTKYYTNYRDLVSKSLDAVIIATPTTTHRDICVDFLHARTHVLVEKPIAASLDEAKSMVDTAKKENCILQVGHSERFNPAFVAAQPYILNPRFIETHRLNQFSPRGTDVDVILDLMIHDLDIILHFMDMFPERIDSVGVPVLSKSVDIANTRLNFPNGAVANLTASRVSMDPIRKFRIFQKETYISIDFKDHDVSIYKRMPPTGNNPIPKIQGFKPEIKKEEPLYLEITNFIDSIRTGKQPHVTGTVGMQALQAALMVIDGAVQHIIE